MMTAILTVLRCQTWIDDKDCIKTWKTRLEGRKRERRNSVWYLRFCRQKGIQSSNGTWSSLICSFTVYLFLYLSRPLFLLSSLDSCLLLSLKESCEFMSSAFDLLFAAGEVGLSSKSSSLSLRFLRLLQYITCTFLEEASVLLVLTTQKAWLIPLSKRSLFSKFLFSQRIFFVCLPEKAVHEEWL